MDVKVETTAIRGLLVIRHQVFEDDRGFFQEVFRRDVFSSVGLPTTFVQLNHSRSVKNVLRGLHFQWDPPMGKMMRVTQGTAFLVAVDIRKGSATFGHWLGRTVTAEDHIQIWAPAGFARGFCVLSDWAEVQYLCTGEYHAEGESGILWNDPALGIQWPLNNPQVSSKDRQAQTLAQWAQRKESDNFRDL